MRPADCAALMKILLFLAGCVDYLLCSLLARCSESPGFAGHELSAEVM